MTDGCEAAIAHRHVHLHRPGAGSIQLAEGECRDDVGGGTGRGGRCHSSRPASAREPHDSLRLMPLVSITAERAYEMGRTAYPSVDLAQATFLTFARTRAESWNGDPDRAADMFLACACVEKIPAAIAEFLAAFGARIPLYLGKLARNADLVEEVRQIVVTRSVIGEADRPPALTGYSAKGSLEGWVRATAVREALAINRRSDRNADDSDAALEAQIPWVDHEISLFKQIYREPVSQAFATACTQLDAEDRALLRLHYVDGVTTAKLATMFAISRATLIRRLAAARESLVERVKSQLKTASGVADNDFDSVLRLVKSQIDLRLSVVLRDEARRI
jgi:RNA polymerase sigma-70 factor, ECF subfamily